MVQIAILAILIALAGPVTGWAIGALTPSAAEIHPADEPPAKIVRYATLLLTRYDNDGSGTLNPTEWGHMQGRPAVMDCDQDGQVTPAEIIRHVSEYARYRRLGYSSLSGQTGVLGPVPSNSGQDTTDASNSLVTTTDKNDPTRSGITSGKKPGVEHPDAPYYVPANLRPSNLPSWFAPRDRNGDGQLSLSEFAPTRSREAVKSFERLDANRDGLLTSQEAAGPTQPKRPATESTGGAE